MPIIDRQRQDLLSFNNGKPLIITLRETTDGCDSFNVSVFVRTISSPTPKFTNSVSLMLSFPADFPTTSPIVQLFQCQLFHPNFTDHGEWLNSNLENNESLSDYLMRLIRVLQYKEIDTINIANRNAMAWYNKTKGRGIFPTDIINYSFKPHISIFRINENTKYS